MLDPRKAMREEEAMMGRPCTLLSAQAIVVGEDEVLLLVYDVEPTSSHGHVIEQRRWAVYGTRRSSAGNVLQPGCLYSGVLGLGYAESDWTSVDARVVLAEDDQPTDSAQGDPTLTQVEALLGEPSDVDWKSRRLIGEDGEVRGIL